MKFGVMFAFMVEFIFMFIPILKSPPAPPPPPLPLNHIFQKKLGQNDHEISLFSIKYVFSNASRQHFNDNVGVLSLHSQEEKKETQTGSYVAQMIIEIADFNSFRIDFMNW